jgi:apolipoprotein D and lipocalin family protein
MKRFIVLLCLLSITGCTSIPDNVSPVNDFELPKYLGKWYEIARLDHSFERGLTQITAEYSLNDDGGVKVVNRGFSMENNQWEAAEGKAYFVGASDVGHLKVSFFGPFYGSYIIFDLDKANYQHAFISGPNTDYLWLLSRTPTVSSKTLQTFKQMAKNKGFITENLILVTHDTN